MESIPQDENSGTQGVQDLENEILSSKSETEFQILSDSESNDDLAGYTVEQIDNGDGVITFESAEHAKLVGWVTFEEVMKDSWRYRCGCTVRNRLHLHSPEYNPLLFAFHRNEQAA